MMFIIALYTIALHSKENQNHSETANIDIVYTSLNKVFLTGPTMLRLTISRAFRYSLFLENIDNSRKSISCSHHVVLRSVDE